MYRDIYLLIHKDIHTALKRKKHSKTVYIYADTLPFHSMCVGVRADTYMH